MYFSVISPQVIEAIRKGSEPSVALDADVVNLTKEEGEPVKVTFNMNDFDWKKFKQEIEGKLHLLISDLKAGQ